MSVFVTHKTLITFPSTADVGEVQVLAEEIIGVVGLPKGICELLLSSGHSPKVSGHVSGVWDFIIKEIKKNHKKE